MVFLIFSAVFIKHTQAEKKASLTVEELIKKAEKVQTLIKEKGAEGLDVSNALKLDQESKEAAGKGNIALAGKLLDDAIMSLTETSSGKKPADENKEPVTKKILLEKAKKLRYLIDESATKGINVSPILKLDNESRIATEKGDLDLADKLLDNAIESFAGSPDKEEPDAAGAEPVTSESLMKKAENFRTLLDEKMSRGTDISEALKLDQAIRTAAEKEDFDLANKLLDNGIKYLIELPDKAASSAEMKEPVTRDSLGEKVEKLRELMQEKNAKGIDVSEADKLGQLSKAAADKGDIFLANKLLDNALKCLDSPPDQKMSKKIPIEKPDTPSVKRMVTLPVSSKSVKITASVTKYEKGEDLTDYKSAFIATTIMAKSGSVILEVGIIPLIVEEKKSKPVGNILPENSPFGFHPANTYGMVIDRGRLIPPSKMGYSYKHALDLGVRWTRPEYYALWHIIQKSNAELKEDILDWKENDYVFGSVPKDLGIVGNIGGTESRTMKGKAPFSKTFTFQSKELEEKYVSFVKRLVERYDGDGVDDMPGLQNPVLYWQVDNEPDISSQDWEGYAHLMEITYKAVKEACPQCKVAMGGLIQGEKGFDTFFLPVLKKLRGKYVDIFDIHLYGVAGTWRYHGQLVEKIKLGLSKNGFKNTDIWVLETGTYSGRPEIGISGNTEMPEQTEKQQAIDLFQRYVVDLSLGIKKIFWAFGIIEGFTAKSNHEFDRMGIIYQKKSAISGQSKEIKKLAFYTYKMMTEKLEGCNFSKIKSLNLGQGVYAYKFDKQGTSIYVLWAE